MPPGAEGASYDFKFGLDPGNFIAPALHSDWPAAWSGSRANPPCPGDVTTAIRCLWLQSTGPAYPTPINDENYARDVGIGLNCHLAHPATRDGRPDRDKPDRREGCACRIGHQQDPKGDESRKESHHEDSPSSARGLVRDCGAGSVAGCRLPPDQNGFVPVGSLLFPLRFSTLVFNLLFPLFRLFSGPALWLFPAVPSDPDSVRREEGIGRVVLNLMDNPVRALYGLIGEPQA